MTLTARIEVGEDQAERAPFPRPDMVVAPRVLDLAATYLLNEDQGVNGRYVYPSIGFDSVAAVDLEAAEWAESRLKRGKPVPPLSTLQKEIRPLVKGLGLELIVAMLLSCLGKPKTAFCPCCAHLDRATGVPLPYGHAPSENPDARADYDGFSVIAEATSQREPRPGKGLREDTIVEQWNSAKAHTKAALLEEDGPGRVYCIMVSRSDLRDARMCRKLLEAPARLAKDPEDPEDPDIGARADDAKFLVFGIKDMGFVGRKLHDLYCLDRTDVLRLTDRAVAGLLDDLHALTLARIAESRKFPQGWAGLTFAELLEARVGRQRPGARRGRKPKNG